MLIRQGQWSPILRSANASSQELAFMFFLEHNTDSGDNDIRCWIPEDGCNHNLPIGRAIEVTTRYGHWQAIGVGRHAQVEWRYTGASGDIGLLNDETQLPPVNEHLASMNH
jgi:hypothetical protein